MVVFTEAPKQFDAVDIVFTTSELVLVVMKAVMQIPIGYQPIISFPAVSLDNTCLRRHTP